MPDLTQDGLRARAGEIVAIEPDGKWWRVVLVCGAQRSTVIRLSERAACEAYAVWIQDTILLPTFTTLVAEARKDGATSACPLCHCCGERRHDGAEPCVSCETAVAEAIESLERRAAQGRAQREFKTHDHPAANGRVPVADDTEWKFTFPLEDSSILSVRVGRTGRAALIRMLHEEQADDEIDAAIRAQEETP